MNGFDPYFLIYVNFQDQKLKDFELDGPKIQFIFMNYPLLFISINFKFWIWL